MGFSICVKEFFLQKNQLEGDELVVGLWCGGGDVS